MKQGAKSSEFWLISALVLDLVAKQAGVYDLVSTDQVLTAAEQVRELAEQLRGETGNESGWLYILATVYVAGRTLLKWKGEA